MANALAMSLFFVFPTDVGAEIYPNVEWIDGFLYIEAYGSIDT